MAVLSLSRASGAALAIALAAAGCATTPPPTEQIAVARSAVADAASAGGPQYATPQFRAARAKLDLAEGAMRVGDYERARLLAEDAEADARLAAAQARSEKAQRAADEVRAGIRALQDAIERQPR